MNKVKCHHTDHHHRWFRLASKQGIGCEYCDEQFVLRELFDIYYEIIGPAFTYVLDEALIQAIGDCLWEEKQNTLNQATITVKDIVDILAKDYNKNSEGALSRQEVGEVIDLIVSKVKGKLSKDISHASVWTEFMKRTGRTEEGLRSNCSLQSEQGVKVNGGTKLAQPLDAGSVQATYSCLPYSKEETDRLQRGGHLSQAISEYLTSLDFLYQNCKQSLAVQHCEYATAVQAFASEQTLIGCKYSPQSVLATDQPEPENRSDQVGTLSRCLLELIPNQLLLSRQDKDKP